MFRCDSCRKPIKERGLARMTVAAVATGALALAMLSLAGCGTAEDPGGTNTTGETGTTIGTGNTGGSTTTVSLDGSIPHPTGAGEVVLRVSDGGGFVPVEYNLTATPEFTIYGDGRVIVSGPVIAIYPGPALPNLQTAMVDEEAIQSLLSAAKEAGLFTNDVDYGQPGITDVSTTSFIINAGGTAYQSDVYALGMEPGAGGLTLEQQQARAALQDFRGKLADLSAFVASPIEWAPYEYEAIAVFSRPIDTSLSTDSTDIAPGRLEWPLGDLSTLGEAGDAGFRRIVVSGADLSTLQQKPPLEKANAITIWTSGGKDYNLYFRPLLPDENA